MQKKIKSIVLVCVQTILIVGITILSVLPVSCKISETGIHVLGGDYVPPVMESVVIESKNTLKLKFAESVKFEGSVVSSKDGCSIGNHIVYNEDNKDVTVVLEQDMKVGAEYEMMGIVKDLVGNSTTFVIPFVGFNSKVAKLMMTEIQSESVSSQNNSEKENGYYRNEYVEFLVISDGNLSGLEFLSAYDGFKRTFGFPAIDVFKGEIILVHLRKRGNGCVSELGDDLNLSKNSYSVNGIRDLWIDNEDTALGNKSDILMVRNSLNGEILDFFMYKDLKMLEWNKEMLEVFEMVDSNEVFCYGNIENAFITTGLTSTKTISRLNSDYYLNKLLNDENIEYPIEYDASNWTISSASPGTL